MEGEQNEFVAADGPILKSDGPILKSGGPIKKSDGPILKSGDDKKEKKDEIIFPLLDVDKFTADMSNLKPTVFLSFPTIFSLLY